MFELDLSFVNIVEHAAIPIFCRTPRYAGYRCSFWRFLRERRIRLDNIGASNQIMRISLVIIPGDVYTHIKTGRLSPRVTRPP